jgi:hypothetical protein
MDTMAECSVVYLAGRNRPTHEVLFGNGKDITAEYERAFVGMTEVDCPLEVLFETRTQLRQELPQRLSAVHETLPRRLMRLMPGCFLVDEQCPPPP